jgi:hypothetical protein
MFHRLRNHFGQMWVKWNLVSIYFEIVLVLVQDMCMICTNVL